VPEQARTRLRTASSGIAMGIIEPSARRFQQHRVRQDYGMPGAVMAVGLRDVDPAPDAALAALAGRWRDGGKLMRADPGPDATVSGMQRAGMTTTPEPVPAR
jgi:hypothetical protein